MADEPIGIWYKANYTIPTCNQWDFIHGTVTQAAQRFRDQGGYWNGDVGSVELYLRRIIPNVPCGSQPVVSNVQSIPSTAGQGTATITWSQNIQGAIKVTVDGTAVNSFVGTAGSNVVYLNGLSAGTHNICVEAA